MKNAKRVLALLLLVATLLGMMTLASAKKQEFTDVNSITKLEAVEVLADMGVVTGYTDGSFQPYGSVTRAEMATMISKLLNEGNTVNESWASSNTFTDLVGVEWAAPHIAFCVSEGVINGRNATTFAPNDKVTGLEAAKMLLGALGYSAAADGLTGANWAKNTLQLGTKADLFRNLNTTPEETLYREGAAQMLLNALEAQMVEYDEGVTSNIAGVVVVDGIKKTELTNTATSYFGAADGKMQMIEKIYPGYVKEDTTDWAGRRAYAWSVGAAEIGVYPYETMLKKYSNYQSVATIYKLIGNIDGDELTIDYYLNGIHYNADNTTSVYNSLKKMESGYGSSVYISGRGDTVEIYFDAYAKTLRVICLRPCYGEIDDVDEEGNVECTIYISTTSVVNGYERTLEETQFTEDDIGAPVKCFVDQAHESGETYVPVELEATLEQVTGTATKSEGAFYGDDPLYLTVGGKRYGVAINARGRGNAQNFPLNQEVTLYVDSTTSAVFRFEPYADSQPNYAYVLRSGKDAAVLPTGDTYYADLLFADGTRESVQYKAKTDDDAVQADILVSYTKSGDVYKLTPVPTYGDGARAGSSDTGYVAGNPSIKYELADHNTVFIVDTAADDASKGEVNVNVSIYTGIKNAPTIRNKVHYVVVNGRIAYVFCNNALDYELTSTEVANAIYVTGQEKRMVGIDVEESPFYYYEYVAVINGESKKVRMLEECTGRDTLRGGWNLFYKASATDSYYTSIEPYSDSDHVKVISNWVKYNNGIVNVAANTPLYVEAETPAYVYDARTDADYITTISRVGSKVADNQSFYLVDDEEKVLAFYMVVNN